jgi:NADH-quinone oxidoreductase subunit C/D
MSEATMVATAPAVESSLPYNDAVPGAVIGEWAATPTRRFLLRPTS